MPCIFDLGKAFLVATVVAAEEVPECEECAVAESSLVQYKMKDVVELLAFRPSTDQLDSRVLQAAHETPFLRFMNFITTEVLFHIATV